MTWVVGFALIADLYAAEERGRVMGLVMSGSTFGFMIGPTIGGWLYKTGGVRLPYLFVAGLSLVVAAGIALLKFPSKNDAHESLPLSTILRVPAVATCVIAVIVGGATIAMLEPVLSLFLNSAIGLGPARIGLVFGGGALVAAVLHPVFGHIADRVGGRRLTLWGLAAIGAMLPILSQSWSFPSAVGAVCDWRACDRDDDHAVADVHGGSDGFRRVAVIWRRVRTLQRRVGGRSACRTGESAASSTNVSDLSALTLVWAPTVVIVALVLSRVDTGRR